MAGPAPRRDLLPRTGAGRRDRARLGGAILLGLLILSSVALIFSAANFDRRLNEVRDADTDNQGWIVSQLEVDHQALVIAASDALISGTENGGPVEAARWDRLQTEFDVFYSRIGVFAAAMRNAGLPADFAEDLADLQRVRGQLAERIDALSPDDIEGLRDFTTLLRDEQDRVRRLVTHGLQVFIDQAQQAREREREIWLFFLIETLVLLSLVLASGVFALRLSRALQQRTIEAERAASTITKAYEASLSAVVVTDFDGRVLLCNKAAETMFRLPMDRIIGSDTLSFAPQRLRASLTATYAQMRACATRDTPCRVSRQTLALRADGQVFPVELALTTDTDADGQPIAIAFVRDISAEVQAERSLRGAVNEARSAAAAKSMFLATMSHEMRTPLHGLIAALDLIDRQRFDAENMALLNTARDCSQRALALVNDVLQFTRASAMREPVVPFRPARIAEEVVGELSPFARENGNSITLNVTGPGAGDRVMGYPAAFSRSLYNLVGNAVKFTAGGRITVDLAFGPMAGDDRIALHVAVTDEGPGIAEADRGRIFELFETSADQTRHSGLGTGLSGTGLGLPITRLAVERMGGALMLDSELGKGSRFWFEIALPRATGADAQPAEDAAAPPVPALPEGLVWNVLVVDDNEVNLTLMQEMVRRLGHRTTLARNGHEAVERARDTAFDVILMDISMPVMDGRSATRAIRHGGASRDAAILGVTALIEAEDPDSFAGCGMDRALVKPIRFDALARALAEVARTRADRVVPPAPAATAAEPAPVPAPAPEDGFDFAALSAMVGGPTAMRLLQATLDDAQITLERARIGAPDAGEAAHRAFGAASMVGWDDLATALREIEFAARDGDTEAVIDLAEALDELMAIARARVAALDLPELAAV